MISLRSLLLLPLAHLLMASEPIPNYHDFFSAVRQNGHRIGYVFIDPSSIVLTGQQQQRLRDLEPAAMAERLLHGYRSQAASAELRALALAMLTDAGYVFGRSSVDAYPFLRGSKRPDPQRLLTAILPLLDTLASHAHPDADLLASELLLQVVSEGLGTMHLAAGNGYRRLQPMPPALAERAASYLDHADPFVRTMADWCISVVVCNANDNAKQLVYTTQNGAPWFQQWLQIDSGEHLMMDHARQLITVDAHRKKAAILSFSDELLQRNLTKAVWTRQHLTGPADRFEQQLHAVQAGLQQLHREASTLPPADFHTAWLSWRQQLRHLALAGADCDFDQLLYVSRHSGKNHLQPGSSSPHHKLGGDIHRQQGLDPAGPTTPLNTSRLGPGFIQGMDLHWNAHRIVFSRLYRGIQTLFEITVDGHELRQVTDGQYHDVDPAWLPSDEIAFGSYRAHVGVMCASGLGFAGTGGSGHTNIFRCNADGQTNRLTYCKDDDACPYPLNDGRIGWLRWDYQERGVNEMFALWAIRPDGSGSDGFFRVHIPRGTTVQALRDHRPIPDSSKIVAIGSGHYNWREGGLIIADPTEGINNPKALRNVTPLTSPVIEGYGGMQAVAEGGVPYPGGYYVKPNPLSDKSFLVSASYDQPCSTNYAGYYVDVWGNKELLRRDQLMSVVCLTPVRSRQRPPVLPDVTDPTSHEAKLFVADVYADLPGIERGAAKFIRVCQMLHWQRKPGQPGLQYHPFANGRESYGYGTGGPVRVIGTVPVADDGSAAFTVPSDMDLYFHLLDENHMSLRHMRTHVEFAPGEVRSCIGCHETKGSVVHPTQNTITAVPQRPIPPPWGDQTLLSFDKHIQPIFDQHCVSCHQGDQAKAGLVLSAQRDAVGHLQSYRSLFGIAPGAVSPYVGYGPDGSWVKGGGEAPEHPWWQLMFDHILIRDDSSAGGVSAPKAYGSHRMPLMRKLVDDPTHRKLLNPVELQTLATWVDIQVPYYDSFVAAHGSGSPQRFQRVQVEPCPPFGATREHRLLLPKADTASLPPARLETESELVAQADGSRQRPFAIPHLPSSIDIDGNLDDWQGIAPIPAPYENLAASNLRLAWNEQGLCGVAQINDEHVQVQALSPYAGDSLEFWFQKDHADTSDMTLQSLQVVFAASDDGQAGHAIVQVPFGIYDQQPGIQAHWQPTASGYLIEFMLPAALLQPASMQPGSLLSMNYAINNDGRPMEQFYCDKGKQNAWRSPAPWGSIYLSGQTTPQ